MKSSLVRSASCALLGSAMVCASHATVFFQDTFTSGSTLNSATPAAPTLNSTSYELSSSKSWNPTPSLDANDLKFGIGTTTSGGIEAQALFTTNPVSLVQAGDYVRLTVVFTNTAGIQTANCLLGFGLYNASQVAPLGGGLNGTALQANTDKYLGGVQNWKGYWGQRGYTGQNSRIVNRFEQPNGTDNRNQNLTSTGSGTQSYGNPSGARVGAESTTPSGPLTVGATYTVVLTITLNADDSLSITNTYYNGPDTNGTVVCEFGGVTTSTTFTTASFDGIGIGWRAGANSTGGTVLDISSILVDGSATVITSPPDILTQPVPVVVSDGGSCAFSVAAQGFAVTYQWKRYGTNLVNGGNISGAKSSMLVISPASGADIATGDDSYYVTISGAGGFTTNSAKVSLTLGTASALVWSGTSGTWDLNNTASFLKGATAAAFNYGDAVTFDDTGVANLGVTLTGPYLSASYMTVDSTAGYVFGGTGSFAGPGGLIYKGSGVLTINNANTYTGGTIISNSLAYLVLNNYSGLGSGPVILAKAGGILETVPAGGNTTGIKGDVVVQDDATIQYDGTGAYAAVLLGNLAGTPGKTLNFLAFNPTATNRIRVYGTATICDANLVINGNATSEAAYGGTTLAPYQNSGYQIYNGVISGLGGVIQRAGGLTVLAGQNLYSGGTTPTTGTIGFGADSIGAVTSGPIGTGPLWLNPEAPNATGSGSVLAFGGARTIANPLQHSSGTNNQTLTIAGTNDLTFTGPYTLNGNDGTTTYTNRILAVNNTALTTFSGPISGAGFGLIKSGSGTLVLAGNNSYTGQTLVTNGTLRVTGTLASPVVVSNATLQGTGTIKGPVSMLALSTLSAGTSIGTLTVNGDLSLAGNLSVEVNKSGSPTADRVDVSGALSASGAGTITVTNLGTELAANDTFTLFNKAVTGAVSRTITGGGVIWTNKLAVDGTIAVLTAIATTPTNVSYSVTGTNITLSWPLSYLTWSLQSNSVSVASAASWYTVPGSQTNTAMTFPINPTKTNVFYRLTKP